MHHRILLYSKHAHDRYMLAIAQTARLLLLLLSLDVPTVTINCYYYFARALIAVELCETSWKLQLQSH
jgi:hypothetical protein